VVLASVAVSCIPGLLSGPRQVLLRLLPLLLLLLLLLWMRMLPMPPAALVLVAVVAVLVFLSRSKFSAWGFRSSLTTTGSRWKSMLCCRLAVAALWFLISQRERGQQLLRRQPSVVRACGSGWRWRGER
jgi:hypothetical protein